MQTDADTWITNDDGGERGRWMQTYSGRKFYLLDPKAEEVHIGDIAHALSQLCRFSGHTSTFYSVAQHSLLCSALAGCEEVAFAALMHDAAEAYVGDMIRPLKRNGRALGRLFCKREAAVEHVISQAFGIVWTPEKRAEVKRLDDVSLAIEAFHLMRNRPWVQELISELLEKTPELTGLLSVYSSWVEPVDMSFIEENFLIRFNELQVRG